jgi:hypothetical protein
VNAKSLCDNRKQKPLEVIWSSLTGN